MTDAEISRLVALKGALRMLIDATRAHADLSYGPHHDLLLSYADEAAEVLSNASAPDGPGPDRAQQ